MRGILETITFAIAATSLCSIPLALAKIEVDNATISAGYHVIYSYAGSTPPSELQTLASQGLVGGLIIFGENVNSNLPSYISSLQSTYASSPAYAGVPLLIVTDQEGGEVLRLPGGPSQSEKQVGSSANPTQAAKTAGTQAASALKAYKHNANLAPVGGVFHSPGDFLDQYQRSYSNDSSIAAECMSAFIQAQQGAGVIATAKHFPGLGGAAAGQDTDAEPVTINISLTSLRSDDEIPFSAAIKAGVRMIMPSWALYPALDNVYPSGLSSKWIKSELRGRLGYKGVTISDAIEAGGLQNFGSSDGYRAILATNAGMDIILASARNVTQGQTIVQALVAAVKNGTISSSDFTTSSQRILNLRRTI